MLFKFVDYKANLGIEKSLILVLVPNAFNITIAYFHYFFLLPLFEKKKYGRYFLYVITALVIVTLARGEVEALFLKGFFNSTYYETWTSTRAVNIFWSTASLVLFIALIKFTIDRFVLESEKKTLQNEKLNAELNYLKAQINPHFLFNTLHNLNYLTQAKSDEATSVIVRLSNIMRYMIYEAPKEKVLLSQEVEYIKDYLSLESIRLNNKLDLKLNLQESDNDIAIAPLLLIPFVENAFKHGVSDKKTENWISIDLIADQNSLQFGVSNSLSGQGNNTTQASGFGLTNLRQRLTLAYPGKHELTTEAKKNQFEVKLNLSLT